MTVKKHTSVHDRMNADELQFWRQCFRQALADCWSIKKTPAFCAQLAGHAADASVVEYRRRVSVAGSAHL
jgi:hypothetical protein